MALSTYDVVQVISYSGYGWEGGVLSLWMSCNSWLRCIPPHYKTFCLYRVPHCSKDQGRQAGWWASSHHSAHRIKCSYSADQGLPLCSKGQESPLWRVRCSYCAWRIRGCHSTSRIRDYCAADWRLGVVVPQPGVLMFRCPCKDKFGCTYHDTYDYN